MYNEICLFSKLDLFKFYISRNTCLNKCLPSKDKILLEYSLNNIYRHTYYYLIF